MNKTFRRCRHYTKCEIAGVSYLLPFGQPIADHRKGLRLNSTGAYLWDLLRKDRTFDELLKLSADHYQANADELLPLREDLKLFLTALHNHGLLSVSDPYTAPSDTDPRCPAPVSSYAEIGGLVLQLCGPAEAFSDAFRPFSTNPQTPDQVIQIISGTPYIHLNGTILVRNEHLIVTECALYYILLFLDNPGLLEAHLQKDGAKAAFYCLPPFTDESRESLFHAIRLSYLYLAQKRGILALHSASLLYREKAWLFSGPSGTGKTTHTNLWQNLLKTPILNGDLNLIAIENGAPLVYGLPWCGTSKRFTTKTYTLGGILLLKQAPEDHVETLTKDQRILLTAHRLISPAWTNAQLQKNLHFAGCLEPRIFICRLCCTRNANAAYTAQEAIDNYLDRRTE